MRRACRASDPRHDYAKLFHIFGGVYRVKPWSNALAGTKVENLGLLASTCVDLRSLWSI